MGAPLALAVLVSPEVLASLPRAPAVVWCFVARRTRPHRLPHLLGSVLYVFVTFYPSRLMRECIAFGCGPYGDLVRCVGVSLHHARPLSTKGRGYPAPEVLHVHGLCMPTP